MNLLSKFKKEEIKLLEDVGLNVENKEYTKEELRKYEMSIGEFIINHSSKNGDITKLINQYDGILKILNKS